MADCFNVHITLKLKHLIFVLQNQITTAKGPVTAADRATRLRHLYHPPLLPLRGETTWLTFTVRFTNINTVSYNATSMIPSFILVLLQCQTCHCSQRVRTSYSTEGQRSTVSLDLSVLMTMRISNHQRGEKKHKPLTGHHQAHRKVP